MKKRAHLRVKQNFNSEYVNRVSYKQFELLWGRSIFNVNNHIEMINKYYSGVFMELQSAVLRNLNLEEEI